MLSLIIDSLAFDRSSKEISPLLNNPETYTSISYCISAIYIKNLTNRNWDPLGLSTFGESLLDPKNESESRNEVNVGTSNPIVFPDKKSSFTSPHNVSLNLFLAKLTVFCKFTAFCVFCFAKRALVILFNS